MRRIKLIITIATALVSLGMVGAGTAQAHALPTSFAALQSQGDACSGLSQLSGASCDNPSSGNLGGQKTIAALVKTIINIISFLAGAIAVILIVVSGIRFMLSGGDSQGAASARNMLIYAIVGLAIVALSQAIVHFVLNAIINNTVSQNGPPS